jgi:hypothetical protein
MLPVVLYGCDTWPIKLREERIMKLSENRVLRKICEPKREAEEYCITRIFITFTLHEKLRRTRWEGHIAGMGEMRNLYSILIGKPEGKRPLGRRRRRWQYIRMGFKETGWEDVDWIHLVQDSDQ